MKKTNLTRLLSMILVLAMALAAFAGCADKDPEETPAATTPAETTPEGTTPDESTPDESDPAESTPAESTPAESTPAESTPAESTPAASEYNITYNLDGGYDCGNPTKYLVAEGVTLKTPVRPGYDFAGWTGTGLDAATKNVTVAKGTTGDLSFTATWTENTVRENNQALETTYFGKDNGLVAKDDVPLSTADKTGSRGEGIYTLKTVYTDIAVDGVMDAAYTYGIHLRSDINTDEEYYADRATKFDVYVVRGQNGKIYVYAEIVDPEIVVNSYIFNTDGEWRVDSIDMYFEFGNYGAGYEMYSFVPDKDGQLKRNMPAETKITLTDTGYTVEFAFDNDGKPVLHNDEVSMQFYLNDANEWNETDKTYKKTLLKHSSALNPVEKGYIMPSPELHDAIKASVASATGKVEIEGLQTEKTGDMIADIISGAASVAIIYDEYATAQSILPAQDLEYFIKSLGGDCTIVREDLLGNVSTKFDYKILFGRTKDAASVALMDQLSYAEYGVKINGDTIVFIGWNEAASEIAYGILYEIFDHVAGGGKTADFGDGLFTGAVPAQVGADVPKLEGFDSVTDVGEGSFLIYDLDSSEEKYNAYLKLLEAAGYKLYTTNKMKDTLCATYVSDDTVVNVVYGGGDPTKPLEEVDRSLRIVVDPLSNAPLPSIEKPEDATASITDTTVTQMYPHNLCIVFQLSNGHFVILDSGNNGTQKELSDFLRKKAPDGKPVVEAWIFSHFHQDHVGGFVDYMDSNSLTKYITVKSVIYNFPQEQVIQTAHKSTTDMKNMTLWYDRIKPKMLEKGTTFYQARTGQKYYFGNAEIEILWTFEDLMPFNVFTDDTNRTDIGVRVKIEGQTVLLTGDSTEEQFRAATKRYGDYLKSDFLQLAHHGSGNGKGSHDLYTIADAPVIFHSRKFTLEESSYQIGANEKKALQNADLVIRSGNYGTATLKLPFTVGDTIESTKTPVDESHTYAK